jgi:hypothetical protein
VQEHGNFDGVAENWRSGIRTLNRFNLPREVRDRPPADHIELSAEQIERLNNLMPAVITEAGMTYPEVESMTFGKIWPN